MDPNAFADSTAGRVVRTPSDYYAFVPNPLPPAELDLRPLAGELETASLALGRLAGIGVSLKNPYLLVRPLARREAVLSSRIEGTHATLSDVFSFEAHEAKRAAKAARPAGAAKPSDVREVHNYAVALEHGMARLATLPISLRLVREIHRMLLEGVRGDYATPGEFRVTQNWIGPPGCTLATATFVPPPVPEMTTALGQWEGFHHAASELPLLVRLAVSHYQFEAIHPFVDGNGRVGRLLIPLLLCEQNVMPQPLLYLSAFFERHRDDYYRLLLGVSRSGAWLDWIRFFLAGVADQASDATVRIDRLQSLQQDYRQRFATARASALLPRLIDRLFENPMITVPQARDELGVTFRAASQNISKLEEAGIVRELTGQDRNRIYVADEVLRLLRDPVT
jgi:Fic family protein